MDRSQIADCMLFSLNSFHIGFPERRNNSIPGLNDLNLLVGDLWTNFLLVSFADFFSILFWLQKPRKKQWSSCSVRYSMQSQRMISKFWYLNHIYNKLTDTPDFDSSVYPRALSIVRWDGLSFQNLKSFITIQSRVATRPRALMFLLIHDTFKMGYQTQIIKQSRYLEICFGMTIRCLATMLEAIFESFVIVSQDMSLQSLRYNITLQKHDNNNKQEHTCPCNETRANDLPPFRLDLRLKYIDFGKNNKFGLIFG